MNDPGLHPRGGDPDLALRDLRRQIHAHPEVSGEEAGTAALMREFLVTCDAGRIIEGLGGHGLAAIFPAPDGAEGPTVLLRAELDALPIQERGDLPHASRREGVAHLCGHDGHMTMLAGVARALRDRPPRRGRVVLLFQPAEETGQGAHQVIQDPRWEQLQPDWAFAIHNLPRYPRGTILLREGAFTAGSVGLIVRLRGRTAHAAYPEQGQSPAGAFARLVPALAALPAALEERGELALVTVVHARLGDRAFGTTPGEAAVMATLRADREDVLSDMRERALALARQEAAREDLAVSCEWVEEFPVTENDAVAVAAAERAARACGLDIDAPAESPFRWSEDFGWFTRGSPGALIGLGSGTQQPVLHAPDYDFPDQLLEPGVAFWEALLAELEIR